MEGYVKKEQRSVTCVLSVLIFVHVYGLDMSFKLRNDRPIVERGRDGVREMGVDVGISRMLGKGKHARRFSGLG
jgi:hypothetical protein